MGHGSERWGRRLVRLVPALQAIRVLARRHVSVRPAVSVSGRLGWGSVQHAACWEVRKLIINHWSRRGHLPAAAVLVVRASITVMIDCQRVPGSTVPYLTVPTKKRRPH
jgi:hypothetical protein